MKAERKWLWPTFGFIWPCPPRLEVGVGCGSQTARMKGLGGDRGLLCTQASLWNMAQKETRAPCVPSPALLGSTKMKPWPSEGMWPSWIQLSWHMRSSRPKSCPEDKLGLCSSEFREILWTNVFSHNQTGKTRTSPKWSVFKNYFNLQMLKNWEQGVPGRLSQ